MSRIKETSWRQGGMRVRVALATIFSYPHAGGLSTHMTSLIEALRQSSLDAFAVSPSQAHARLQLTARLPASVLRMLSSGEAWLVYSQEARARILKSQLLARRPDLVAAQDVIAARVAAELGLPCVLTVHGYLAREAVARGAVTESSVAEIYLKGQERLGYRLAQQVVTVDQRLRRHVSDESGRSDVKMIENFVPESFMVLVDRLRKTLPPRQGVTIVCPRRLTAKNGAAVAVKALLHLPSDYRLDIVGDGEQRVAIRNLIERTGLSARVRMLGKQDREGTAKAFAAADVAVIPSLPVAGVEEATSIAALEAMAVGLPTVASAIGGLTQIIRHGQTGLLVPPGDEKALAGAILGLNESLALELGEAARHEILTSHSARAAAESFSAIYQSVLQKRLEKGLKVTVS